MRRSGRSRDARPARASWVALAFGGLLLWLGLASGACQPDDGEAEPVTVFAAASLTEAFTVLADSFAAQQPAWSVALNIAGSQQLAQQLRLGAPADVFASANERQMQGVVEAGRIAADAPVPFVRNRLAIVVPADNPARIAQMADLAQPGLQLVLAASAVPVGRYARKVLARASTAEALGTGFADAVLRNVSSEEQNVRAVLTKVALGEADAGIVYTSDLTSADRVRAIVVPPAYNVTAQYLIAPVEDVARPKAAAAFVAFARGSTGQAILARHGFTPLASVADTAALAVASLDPTGD